jgi:hypothetical protein
MERAEAKIVEQYRQGLADVPGLLLPYAPNILIPSGISSLSVILSATHYRNLTAAGIGALHYPLPPLTAGLRGNEFQAR